MPYCPKCGREVKEGEAFCSNCGQALAAATSQPVSAQVTRMQEQRPTGITILAVLEILGGIAFLLLGMFALVIAGFLRIAGLRFGMGIFPFLAGAIAGFVGILLLAIGVLSFVISYGYWNGRGWAWTIGLIFAVIGVISGLLTLPGGIVRVLLDGLMIYYLTRPRVKRFFGKQSVIVTV